MFGDIKMETNEQTEKQMINIIKKEKNEICQILQ